jgi:flagellar hook-length control protein FliK
MMGGRSTTGNGSAKASGSNTAATTARGRDANPQVASQVANDSDPAPSTSSGSDASTQPANGAGATKKATTGTTPTANGASSQNSADTAPNAASISSAAAVVVVASPLDPGQPQAPVLPAKASGSDGKGDGSGDNSAANSSAATGTPDQAQAAANPSLPVAAAVVVNTSVATAPTAIGEPAKGRALSATAIAAGQDVSLTQDTTDGAPTKPAPDSIAKAAPDSATVNAEKQAANGGTSPAQTQTADDAALQTDGPVPANADRASTRAEDLSTAASSGASAGASNAQSGTAGTKADISGLPNFGFTALAAAAASNDAGSAPSSAASTAAVPIAGLAVAIASRAQAGSNQFDIRLDPPELGRIDVRLAVDHNGQVTTHVTAERADTLDLLQSQQPQLERALEQAGLKTADNGLQFTLRDQSFTGQNSGSDPQTNGAAQLVIPDSDLTPVAATQIYARAGIGGGVDIRV